MKNTLLILLSTAAMLLSGCATPHKSDLDTMQGQWSGRELTGNAQGGLSLTISGQTLDYHNADNSEWYKGIITLREDTAPKQFFFLLTGSPDSQYVGKTAPGIYRFEAGTLYITVFGPDEPNPPSTFDAPGTRQVVFTRK